jgi:hypothetical protein
MSWKNFSQIIRIVPDPVTGNLADSADFQSDFAWVDKSAFHVAELESSPH